MITFVLEFGYPAYIGSAGETFRFKSFVECLVRVSDRRSRWNRTRVYGLRNFLFIVSAGRKTGAQSYRSIAGKNEILKKGNLHW